MGWNAKGDEYKPVVSIQVTKSNPVIFFHPHREIQTTSTPTCSVESSQAICLTQRKTMWSRCWRRQSGASVSFHSASYPRSSTSGDCPTKPSTRIRTRRGRLTGSTSSATSTSWRPTQRRSTCWRSAWPKPSSCCNSMSKRRMCWLSGSWPSWRDWPSLTWTVPCSAFASPRLGSLTNRSRRLWSIVLLNNAWTPTDLYLKVVSSIWL